MPNFSEIKLFQVKPACLDDFEKLIAEIAIEQRLQPGCASLHYMKRFFTLEDSDTLEGSGSPRELTKIVKCVKYFSYWEFESKEQYADAIRWFFRQYRKPIEKLLIMPFDINLGYSLLSTAN